MNANRIKFMFGVLPSHWVSEDGSCKSGSLKHILSVCKTTLNKGPYCTRGNIIRFLNHLRVCLRINKSTLTLCWLKTGTIECIMCKRGRKVDPRHVQTVLANGPN